MNRVIINSLNDNIKIGYYDQRSEFLIKAKRESIHELPEIMKKYSIDISYQTGVYFISRMGELYIGESKDIIKRIGQHDSKIPQDFKWITFAFSAHQFIKYEKHEVRDLESILINTASKIGVDLKNIKNEKRKILNDKISALFLEKTAERIWSLFQMMNIDQIINNYKSSNEELIYELENKDLINKDIKHKKNSKHPELVSHTIEEKYDKSNLDIFKYVEHINYYPKSYIGRNKRCFKKEIAEDALFMYLYQNISGREIERKLMPNKNNPKGFVFARTLAFFQISTIGQQGILFEKGVPQNKSRFLIKNLIKNNY